VPERSGEVAATDIVKSDSVTLIDLLAEIDQSVDPSLGAHLVMGNGSSHTSKETRRWLEAHPRLVAHYTPRHASWVNMVELFFSIITRKVLRDEAASPPATTWSSGSCASSPATTRQPGHLPGPTQVSR